MTRDGCAYFHCFGPVQSKIMPICFLRKIDAESLMVISE